MADITNQTGPELLLDDEGIDTTDDRTIPRNFGAVYSPYEAAEYEEGQYTYEAVTEQNVKLFNILGYEDPELKSEAFIDVYRKLAVATEAATETDQYVTYSLEELDEELPLFSISDYFSKAGYTNVDQIVITDTGELSAFAQVFTDEKLEGWKGVFSEQLLENFVLCLPVDVADAAMGFWGAYFAADTENYNDYKILNTYVLPLVSVDLCQIYMEQNDVSALKESISRLFQKLTDIFSDDIRNLDWMTEETKEAALEKLSTMQLVVLRPDNMEIPSGVDYVSKEDGGTLLSNMALYLKARQERYNTECGQKLTNRDAWMANGILSDNAFYIPAMNSAIVPLGFFIGKAYSDSLPVEKQLALLGTTLGHEMTHGFDYNGSQYGADGSIRDWWTQEDYDKFTDKCQAVVDYYAGMEFLPGFANDSQYTLDENIADMGGMKNTLALAETIDGFDYDLFFRTYASEHVISSTRPAASLYLVNNEHSAGRVRVDRLMSLSDEFYATYNVEPGDAMYVAPEDRVSVWQTSDFHNEKALKHLRFRAFALF